MDVGHLPKPLSLFLYLFILRQNLLMNLNDLARLVGQWMLAIIFFSILHTIQIQVNAITLDFLTGMQWI